MVGSQFFAVWVPQTSMATNPKRHGSVLITHAQKKNTVHTVYKGKNVVRTQFFCRVSGQLKANRQLPLKLVSKKYGLCRGAHERFSFFNISTIISLEETFNVGFY